MFASFQLLHHSHVAKTVPAFPRDTLRAAMLLSFIHVFVDGYSMAGLGCERSERQGIVKICPVVNPKTWHAVRKARNIVKICPVLHPMTCIGVSTVKYAKKYNVERRRVREREREIYI